MSATVPNPGQPWQPTTPYEQAAPQYAPTPQYAAQGPSAPPARPGSHGSVLHRWPAWAQNTALAVGAVAILVVVFFAGFFTANAVDGPRAGFGTDQNFTPRQFGGNGNGFGGQPGSGFGGQSGSGQSGSGNGS